MNDKWGKEDWDELAAIVGFLVMATAGMGALFIIVYALTGGE